MAATASSDEEEEGHREGHVTENLMLQATTRKEDGVIRMAPSLLFYFLASRNGLALFIEVAGAKAPEVFLFSFPKGRVPFDKAYM